MTSIFCINCKCARCLLLQYEAKQKRIFINKTINTNNKDSIKKKKKKKKKNKNIIKSNDYVTLTKNDLIDE
jgi:hypothetical protein